MARSEARLQIGMWRAGLEGANAFEKLVYAVLLTESTLNHAGVGAIRLTRWAKDASLTVEETEKALTGLCNGNWVILDDDTEEVFVRTLLRHDKVAEQPYVLKGALKEALLTVSPRIRVALAAELRRLPPRQPDGVAKNGKAVIYPDPHATADVLDPPPEPRPSRHPSERVSEASNAVQKTPSKGKGEGEGEGEGVSPVSSNSSSEGARKRGTRLPEDFAVTADMVAWARAQHPTVDGRAETERFRDHFRGAPGQKGVKLDWPATWRNWIRTAAERAPRTGNPRHLAPVQAVLPADPTAAFEDLRERRDGRGAATLLGVPYLPRPQPPKDDTPSRAWDHAEALRFIDDHAAAIKAALTERTAG